MEDLIERLKNDNNVTKSTAFKYVGDLYRLNEEEPFNSLTFLKDIDKILSVLSDKAVSTQKAYIGSILGVLSLYKSGSKYKNLSKKYNTLLKNMESKNEDKIENNEKTDKQTKNWITWKEVMNTRNNLSNEVNKFIHNKKLKTSQYNKLIELVVLALYTYQPPRRNEYSNMEIVQANNGKTKDESKNYLVLKSKSFIFNKYKTSKTYGNQTIKIHDELYGLIQKYLKHHPLYKKGKSNIPFLVNSEGSKLNQSNGITRVLNRVFKDTGKNIGASLLRHSYLSHKFGDELEEKKKIADKMAHSTSQQTEYIKTD